MDIISKLLLDFDPAMIIIIYLIYKQLTKRITQLEEELKKWKEKKE